MIQLANYKNGFFESRYRMEKIQMLLFQKYCPGWKVTDRIFNKGAYLIMFNSEKNTSRIKTAQINNNTNTKLVYSILHTKTFVDYYGSLAKLIIVSMNILFFPIMVYTFS